MRSLLCHPKSERDRSRWPRMLWDALEALIARVHRKPPNCKPPRVLHVPKQQMVSALSVQLWRIVKVCRPIAIYSGTLVKPEND
jgi:hypothetical protein